MNFKDAFTPAPEEFHQTLISTLSSIEEGKKVKKAMIRSPLIAAAIVVLIVSAAFATSMNPATDTIITSPPPSSQTQTAPAVVSPSEQEAAFAEKIGEIITFGSYEQDNNLENGAEPIQWQILDVQDGRMLVISKYALALQQYHHVIEVDSSLTWENWDIRAWLNGEFLESTFTDAELAAIPTVTVKAEGTRHYSTDPGNDTEDKLFFLSYMEALHYFQSAKIRKCQPTEYAVAQYKAINKTEEIPAGFYNTDSGNCSWWLRTPGEFSGSATFAGTDGNVRFMSSLAMSTNENTDYGFGVRPAMWIDLATGADLMGEMPAEATPAPVPVAPTPTPIPVSSIHDVFEEPMLVSVLPPEHVGFSDVTSIDDLVQFGLQTRGPNIETIAADEWENILFYITDTIVASNSHLIDSVFIASVHRTTGELKITEISNEMAITLPNIGIFTLKALYEYDPNYILVGAVNRAFSMNIVDYFSFIPSDLAEGTPMPETGEEYFLTALKHWKNSGSLTGIEFDALLKRIEASEITEVQHLSLPLEGTYSSENGFNIINVDYEANTDALNEFIYGTTTPFAGHPLYKYFGIYSTPAPEPAN